MSLPRISVIICTHNPDPELFCKVLSGLRRQTLERTVWELVVVDNASDPPVAVMPCMGGVDGDARVVREERPGLVFARCTGTLYAAGEILVFLDDDNFLKPDYLERALNIFSDRSLESVGMCGGTVEPVFESSPPRWLDSVKNHLAVRNHGTRAMISKAPDLSFPEPVGAGMAMRRAVAEKFAEFVNDNAPLRSLGRKGKQLAGCEDTLMVLICYGCGFHVAYFPCLKLLHYIPAGRMTVRYHIRLAGALGKSLAQLMRFVDDSRLRRSAPSRVLYLLIHFFSCLKNEKMFSAALIKWLWMASFVMYSKTIWGDLKYREIEV
ncbi:MAG TPA: glycosyltransferase family 2 protein [Thermodesulfobacteriaceae bacterium]|nr:glycosyltransferase family 2 protein [Thermodesulfobacteriaceae bacterium]